MNGPINENIIKPRALLIYDTDRIIDTTHSLYQEIMIYGDQLEEVHVFSFVKKLNIANAIVNKLSENVFVYSLPSKNMFWEIDNIWRMIKNQIIWQKKIRVDFILNFSTHFGAFIGYYLAKRFNRKFYVSSSGSFVDLPKYSPQFISQYILLKLANGVIVPGEKIANALINHGGVQNDKISVVRTPINLNFIEHKKGLVKYADVYPQHNLFLMSCVSLSAKRDIDFLLKVFKRIVNKYTRTALIVMVSSEQLHQIKKIVSKLNNSSIYVHHIGEDFIDNLASANLFLSVSESDEIASPLINALALHVPVVTTESVIAKEIFTDTRFEYFMKPIGDFEGYTNAVLKLIENQQIQNDYRLNSPILIKDLTLPTISGQVASTLSIIEQNENKING